MYSYALCALPPSTHARTHARTRAHTRAHTRARAHTHTHIYIYISDLPYELGSFGARLQTLSLRGNQLQRLPQIACSLIELRELDLSDNALSELPLELARHTHIYDASSAHAHAMHTPCTRHAHATRACGIHTRYLHAVCVYQAACRVCTRRAS